MKICKNCGAEMPEDLKFCGKCGINFIISEPPKKICQNCNKEIPNDMKFCGSCGTAYIMSNIGNNNLQNIPPQPVQYQQPFQTSTNIGFKVHGQRIALVFLALVGIVSAFLPWVEYDNLIETGLDMELGIFSIIVNIAIIVISLTGKLFEITNTVRSIINFVLCGFIAFMVVLMTISFKENVNELMGIGLSFYVALIIAIISLISIIVNLVSNSKKR